MLHICMFVCVCVWLCVLCVSTIHVKSIRLLLATYTKIYTFIFSTSDMIKYVGKKNIQGSIHYIYKMEKPKRKWRWNFVFMFQPNSKAHANEMKNASKTKPKYYLTGPSYKQCEWSLFFRNFYWLAKLANDRKILSTTKCIEVS